MAMEEKETDGSDREWECGGLVLALPLNSGLLWACHLSPVRPQEEVRVQSHYL